MDLDDTLVALADETRRGILKRLAAGDARVTEVAAPFDISLNSVSKHIRILERAGLIRREIIGREHHCSLKAKPLRDAMAWLEHYRRFWEIRLDLLARHIQTEKKKRSKIR